jgi:hypothetical protein
MQFGQQTERDQASNRMVPELPGDPSSRRNRPDKSTH